MTVAEIASVAVAIISAVLAAWAANRAATLQADKQESDQALANISTAFAQMQAINKELEDARAELRAELIALKIEFEALRADSRAKADAWTDENRQLRTEILGLKSNISNQEKIIAELKAANAELVQQMAELRTQTVGKIADQDSTIAALRQENAALKAEIARLKAAQPSE